MIWLLPLAVGAGALWLWNRATPAPAPAPARVLSPAEVQAIYGAPPPYAGSLSGQASPALLGAYVAPERGLGGGDWGQAGLGVGYPSVGVEPPQYVAPQPLYAAPQPYMEPQPTPAAPTPTPIAILRCAVDRCWIRPEPKPWDDAMGRFGFTAPKGHAVGVLSYGPVGWAHVIVQHPEDGIQEGWVETKFLAHPAGAQSTAVSSQPSAPGAPGTGAVASRFQRPMAQTSIQGRMTPRMKRQQKAQRAAR